MAKSNLEKAMEKNDRKLSAGRKDFDKFMTKKHK
jgi:hypothetical protein